MTFCQRKIIATFRKSVKIDLLSKSIIHFLLIILLCSRGINKMKLLKKINITVLGLLALTGSLFTYKINHQSSTTSASAWSGVQTSQEGSYFSSVGAETGESLKLKLRSIISSGTSESYDWPRYEAADEAEGEPSKVLLIYSRQKVAKTAHVSGSVGWNREHSFAKSLFNDQTPAVNDNHHIFADDNKTNSNRGNKPFNELDPTSSTRSYDGYGNATDNYYTASYFMPNDLAKGEVARSTMYVNTRYNYDVTLNFYSVELMLRWHLENPVTYREVYRNNVVHNLQGNRNPYIDHQDWACKVYGNTNTATQTLCNGAPEPVAPTSINVTPSSASVNLGSTLNLTATVLPSGASQNVVWEGSNSGIATVSNGVVTPVSVGQVTITARSTVNSLIYGSASINVTNTPISVSSISLDKSTLNLTVGSTSQVVATLLPSNATNNTINWSSTNNTIASVNASGLVSANGVGSATITATTVDGGFTSSVSVSVSEETVFEPIYTFTFSASGNPSWTATSGFGAYYSTGYGVEKTGGSVLNLNATTQIPLGSTISVTIAAVTNHATNNTLMTIYALDSEGARIYSISGSTYTPSNESGTITTQTSFARANLKTITLPVSQTYKVKGLELYFGSSGSKTLLVDINISYSLGLNIQQAEAYANYVNDDIGSGAFGQCTSVLSLIQTEFAMLTPESRTLFASTSGQNFADARARITYLESFVQSSSHVSRITVNLSKQSNVIAVVLIALIAVSSISGYYLLTKHKKYGK